MWTLVALGRSAGAQDVLTEAEVIDLARARSPTGAVARAHAGLAAAREQTAGPFPNPSVEWTRETIETGPIGSQDIVVLTVPIDIARPLAMRSLVAAESAWMRTESSLAETNAALEALLAYYEVVLAERRIRVLAAAVENLAEAARVLRAREAAGDTSGYESLRLAIASELGKSHLAEARGGLAGAKTRLGALLRMDPKSIRVASSLSLMPPGAEAALARRAGRSEALEQARAAQRLAEDAQDRAAWAWLPAVDLVGGMKRVSDLGGGVGYVVGISLSVPIFDHGQALRAEAEALRTLSSTRTEALTRTLDAEVQAAIAVYRAARTELERFDSQTSGQTAALLRAAQSGYREGERSVVELLDAQRVQTEVAERRLTLLGRAKGAEARMRASAGDLQ